MQFEHAVATAASDRLRKRLCRALVSSGTRRADSNLDPRGKHLTKSEAAAANLSNHCLQ